MGLTLVLYLFNLVTAGARKNNDVTPDVTRVTFWAVLIVPHFLNGTGTPVQKRRLGTFTPNFQGLTVQLELSMRTELLEVSIPVFLGMLQIPYLAHL